ncbi:MAG TPA: peptide chain release factor N(5)-glutamine methyltransferase [Chloroflexota bacterium]|nr:peptide chain release factor N(5)-glutamine methyltransferase [Chloroflexota bacterium]
MKTTAPFNDLTPQPSSLMGRGCVGITGPAQGWTVAALLADAASRLRAAGVEAPRHEALLLLAHALGATKTHLLAHPDRPVEGEEAERFASLVARRAAHEPYAYVVGEREFYGRGFLVDRRVLVPRPETEVLVEQALVALSELRGHGVPKPVVVDVGTGSGVIACILALHAPEALVVAVDDSTAALEVAEANRRQLGLAERVRLMRGDLLGWLGSAADLVVANLPYLPSSRIGALGPEVREFEPRHALDGGQDGADLMRRLLAQAPARIRSGGSLLLEVDPPQVEAPADALPAARRRVFQDLAGLDRVLRLDLP